MGTPCSGSGLSSDSCPLLRLCHRRRQTLQRRSAAGVGNAIATKSTRNHEEFSCLLVLFVAMLMEVSRMKGQKLYGQAFGRPLAILPGKAEAITGLLYRHQHGQQLDQLSVAVAVEKEEGPQQYLVDVHSGERCAEPPKGGTPAARYIAVLPLYGTLVQHAGVMTDYSGGTSLQAWVEDFRRLADHPQPAPNRLSDAGTVALADSAHGPAHSRLDGRPDVGESRGQRVHAVEVHLRRTVRRNQ